MATNPGLAKTGSLARLAAATAAVAAAVYLVPASAHIVAWPAGGPLRVALLPPLSRLWWALGVSVAVTAAVAAAWVKSERDLDNLAAAAAPLNLLLLWIVPFLPWLPDRAPLLLLLAEPLRWVAAAAAAGGAVTRVVANLGAPRVVDLARVLISPRTLPSRRLRLLLFAVGFASYAALGLWSASEVGFGGDEPHYLVIAHSLLVDHDLDISNNHARRDYRAFFPRDLRPDYLQRGIHGEIYSIHAPGLPLAVLPAYAIAGAPGAVVMVALLAALTALAIFDLAALIVGGTTAVVTWLAVCLTVPFLPHAWLIYPEMAAALIVAWSVLWLWRGPRSAGQVFIAGLALGALPWLHTKFVVLLVCLAALHVAAAWPRIKHIAALGAPILVSTAAWLYAVYHMYGVLDPEAPYGSSTQVNLLLQNIPRGVLGLLLDQKFGLLAFSPVYALAIAGAALMLRERRLRRHAVSLIVVAGLFVASTTRFYMWWGGSSAPARFLVPVVPLLAPMIAVAIERLKKTVARSLVVVTVIVSLAIAGAGVASPQQRFLYSDPHGVSEVVRAVQGSAPLDQALPTFTEENWGKPLAVAGLWVLALLIAAVVTAWLALKRVVRSQFWTAATMLSVSGLVAAVAIGTRPPPERDSIVQRGRLALMREYDPSRLRAVDYRRMQRVSDADVLTAAVVSLAGLGEPVELPEGRYEARLWFVGNRPPPGEAFAALSDEVVIGLAAQPLGNPAIVSFRMPLTSPAWVQVTGTAAASVRRIEIAPIAIVPRSARAGLTIRRAERLDGQQPGYLAYTDQNTYAEGGVYWTRSTEKGTVAVVPATTATTLTLIVHIGPNAGHVAIEVAGYRYDVDLAAEETREIRIPVRPAPWLKVAVQASRAFRPAEVDLTSDDRRRLGCQVRPRLE